MYGTMVRDINLFFDSESKEYIITSGKFTLKLSEEEFNSIKKSINGISYALSLKCRSAIPKNKNQENQLVQENKTIKQIV